MPDSFEVSTTLEAGPEALFDAWLDSKEHGAFIEGAAEIDGTLGGEFRIWDGYITGRNLTLERPRRIVQSWRTTEFPETAPDSRLEVRFEPEGEGTRLTLSHSEIPDGQGPQYEAGWQDHYFEKMRGYFSKSR